MEIMLVNGMLRGPDVCALIPIEIKGVQEELLSIVREQYATRGPLISIHAQLPLLPRGPILVEMKFGKEKQSYLDYSYIQPPRGSAAPPRLVPFRE